MLVVTFFSSLNTKQMDNDFDTPVSSATQNTQDSLVGTTTTDDRVLPPEVKTILDNFETRSSQKQQEILKNLEGPTARKEQREAAALIREMYSFAEPQNKQEGSENTDLAEQLAEMRKIKAEIDEAKQTTLLERDSTLKEKTIRNYLATHKIDADIDDVLGDRNFVKNFLSNKDLPMDKRVKLSMVDTYGGNTDWLSDRKNKTAIGQSSSSGNSGFKEPKGLKALGETNLEQWAKQKGFGAVNYSAR